MIINMWSGPRNISTALMRSFENRQDTIVIDEPFYAFYLKKTKLKHPMYEKIIKKYETNEKKIIINLIKKNNKKIKFIKHMTHHININNNLDWLNNTKNVFLIRDPKKVINSYIKKNNLKSINDLGFIEQLKIFEYVKSNSKKIPVVINSSNLIHNPKKILKKLCNSIDLEFDQNMLKWPKGNRSSDGIWSKIWYKKVIQSSNFKKDKNDFINIPSEYNEILEESHKIYLKLDKYSIKN